VPAKHLLGLHCAFKAEIGEARLHHRGEQRHHGIGLLARGGIGMMARDVHLQGHPARQRARLKAANVEQHPAHIGMVDDRHQRVLPSALRPCIRSRA
jgi:hypothetical protein